MPSALEGQSLSHWTTREVPDLSFFYRSFIQSFTIQQTFLKLLFCAGEYKDERQSSGH